MTIIKAGRLALDTRELSSSLYSAFVVGGDKRVAIAQGNDDIVYKLQGYFQHSEVTVGGSQSVDLSGCAGIGCLFAWLSTPPESPEYTYDTYEGYVSRITAYDGKQLLYEARGLRYFSLYSFRGSSYSGADDFLADNDHITGSTKNDYLFGSSGNDTLIGGIGHDVLDGGEGYDTADYSGSAAAVFINLVSGNNSGGDANGDQLIDIENIKGSRYADHLIGNDGDNVFDGGLGRDTMDGGNGNDTYTIDRVDDIIIENDDAGIDTVRATITYTLPKDFETLVLLGALNINGTGNDSDNHITGNDGRNVLEGGAGNDVLDGRAGLDTLIGGAGDDTYVIDDVRELRKTRVDPGIDTVIANFTYALGPFQEHLSLQGREDIDGRGNNLDNIIIGNAGDNTLSGGDGNDYLDGRRGIDLLKGDAGDDTYVIDNAKELQRSLSDPGFDTVRSYVSYTLGAQQEDLVLLGAKNIAGTGNKFANHLLGNAASNLLIGGAGDDVLDGGEGFDDLRGGLGDDTYYVDHDTEISSTIADPGYDTVISTAYHFTLGPEQEALVLGSGSTSGTGNAFDNVITGNGGGNYLYGYDGNDVLVGGDGLGYDFLYGGNGDDELIAGSNGAFLAGGAGVDQLKGGTGNDTYSIDADTEIDRLLNDPGVDLVRTSIDYTLGPIKKI